METKAPIILMHSMFPPRITKDAVLEALPDEQRGMALDWVTIQPDYRELERFDHGYDWHGAAARQREQFEAELYPLLEADPIRPLIYFGLAPIPLAFHLGTLVTHRARLQIHQHHHVRADWRWSSPDEPLRSRPLTVPVGALGEDESAVEDLVLRVSTSHAVKARDTREALSGRMKTVHNVELRVQEDPDPDFFESRVDLEEFCRAFGTLIDDLNRRYPSARALHLFAAVPCGVAFRMGTLYSNLKKLKPIHTYQYDQHSEPRYAPALQLGAVTRASLLLLTADSPGFTPTSGLSEVKTICDLFEPHGSRIKVSAVPGLTASELHRRLDCHARILHFAGHGTHPIGSREDGARELVCPEIAEPGALVLLGIDGRSISVRHDDLVSIVKGGRPQGLRCVVLAACHSAELAERLVDEAGVEHAIGFHGAIDDQAAREFSVAFYRGMLKHGVVEDAFEEGERQIAFAGRDGREQVEYFPKLGRSRRPLIH